MSILKNTVQPTGARSRLKRRLLWRTSGGILAGLLCVLALSQQARLARADACTTTTYNYAENFGTATFRDSSTAGQGWPGLTGFTSLFGPGNWAGNSSTAYFGERVLSVAAGDFNDDQKDDLAVVSAGNASGCQVEIFLGSTSNKLSTANRTIVDTVCSATVGTVIAVGDVDHDGFFDFVVAGVTNPDYAGLVSTATLYHNTTAAVGNTPTFTKIDITGMLTAQKIAWHAGGSQLQLTDYDGDGLADLVVLTSAGASTQVLVYYGIAPAISPLYFNPAPDVLIANVPLYGPIASSSAQASNGNNCMPTAGMVSRGGTLLEVADFFNTGYPGIRIGSVSEKRFLSYAQNAFGGLTRQVDVAFDAGGPLLATNADINGDGRPDYGTLRSGAHCGGGPGEFFPYMGADGGPELYDQPTQGLYPPATFAAVLDVNNDGLNDLLLGRSLGNGRYTVYYGQATGKNFYATATSKNVATSINTATTGVVTAQITNLTFKSGKFWQASGWVSNDGGLHWELLQGSPVGGSGPSIYSSTINGVSVAGAPSEMTGAYSHDFHNYGSSLQFRIKLLGSDITLTGVDLAYTAAPTAYFTRSNVAQGAIKTAQGGSKDILLSAGFQFPGFDARLYNYDLSATATGTATGLGRIDDTLPKLWEAGGLLAARAGTSRTLYSAAPIPQVPATDEIFDQRINFTVSEAASPTTTPSLTTMMGLAAGQTGPAVTFLAGGMNRADKWKFLDPGHSSPVIVNPPNQDPNYMAPGYAAFVAAQSSRAPFVLIGSNDGMLHAFDAQSGAELWGYTPSNLLSVIATQRARDPNTGMNNYRHNYMVDGPVTVSDVSSGGTWRTVAVVGEALGNSSSGANYYFAVDVTNPANPQPLWEWTEPAPDNSRTCNGVPEYIFCRNACSRSTSLCGNENTVYDGEFVVNKAVLDAGGGPTGMIEGEHYDDSQTSSAGIYWGVPIAANFLIAGGASGNTYVQAGGLTACTGGSQANVKPCAFVSYRFVVDSNSAGTLTPWFRIYQNPLIDNSISWALDGNFVQTLTPSTSGVAQWSWTAGTAVPINTGDHYITVYMRAPQVILDAIAIQGSATAAPASSIKESAARTCDFSCTLTDPLHTFGGCTTAALTSPNTQEWPSCGVGLGLKCCPSGTRFFCAPVNSNCATPGSVTGQTFSRPQMGRIKTTSGDKYVAFFASGYNVQNAVNVGRTIYAIEAYTGKLLGKWTLPDVAVNASNPGIEATMPASVTLVDVDNDGYVDRLYAPDLQGRVWKLNTYKTIALGAAGAMTNASDYSTCVFFDAGNPQQGSNRVWAPIVTKPAAAILAKNTVNVYFGTGGDDNAPSNVMYKFYSVRDSDAINACTNSTRKESDLTITKLEWVNGDGLTNTEPKVALADPASEGVPGERYWADPLVVSNSSVYFSSFAGQIDQINPCIDIAGSSKVYAYAAAPFTDASGARHIAGQSLFANKAAYLASTGKIRNAAILRNDISSQVVHSAVGPSLASKNDVFLQQFGGQVMRLSTPGVINATPLRVQRWRELGL